MTLEHIFYVAEAATISIFVVTMLLLVLSPMLFLLAHSTGLTRVARDKKAEDNRKKLRLVKGGKKK